LDPIELIKEGGIKRYFRATRKLNVPGLVCHITQRAAGKEPLFLERSDYLAMIWLLKEASRKHFLQIYAFCLMPNHIHLLLSFSEGSLYDAMRDLFAQYAMKFNKKYERKGHLFGGPYRQAVCLDNGYLVAASLYIHLNPVKAGLSENPYKYRWSSCRLYGRSSEHKTFVDPGLVLGLLSGNTFQSRQRYQELVLRGSEVEMRPVSEEKKAVESFLFLLGQKVPHLWSWFRDRRAAGNLKAPVLDETESWEDKINDLKCEGLSRNPVNRAALKHAIEQLIARGYAREEIAQKLRLSRKTVYNLLQ
jgi:putative transposase